MSAQRIWHGRGSKVKRESIIVRIVLGSRSLCYFVLGFKFLASSFAFCIYGPLLSFANQLRFSQFEGYAVVEAALCLGFFFSDAHDMALYKDINCEIKKNSEKTRKPLSLGKNLMLGRLFPKPHFTYTIVKSNITEEAPSIPTITTADEPGLRITYISADKIVKIAPTTYSTITCVSVLVTGFIFSLSLSVLRAFTISAGNSFLQ